MPLELKSVSVICSRELTAEFDVVHYTPGREGTCLQQPLTLVIHPGGNAICSLRVNDCQAATPDESLDRMAAWLRRLAEGIETRKPSTLIPLS